MSTEAMISPMAVAGLAVTYTLLLVLPFYASPTTRPRPGLDRNDERVIRARIRLVSVTCGVCTCVSVALIHFGLDFDWTDTLHLLGWVPVGWRASGRALALVAVLFAGPVFEKAVVEQRVRHWLTGAALREDLRSWQWWRNIVVGPISEELLFRSTLIPLYLLSQTQSQSQARASISSSSSSSSLPLSPLNPSLPILWSPVPFALAHLHHFHESRLTNPHVPIAAHVAIALLQFTYTALFGWFAALLFVRSGSLAACIACHAFCNWMGLPRFWGRVAAPAPRLSFSSNFSSSSTRPSQRRDDEDGLGHGQAHDDANPVAAGVEALEKRPHKRYGATSVQDQQRTARILPARDAALGHDDDKDEDHWTAHTIFYTVTYYALLLGGALGFRALLWEWTVSGDGLVVSPIRR